MTLTPRCASVAITGLGKLGSRHQTPQIAALLDEVLADSNEAVVVRNSAFVAKTGIDMAPDSSLIDSFCLVVERLCGPGALDARE